MKEKNIIEAGGIAFMVLGGNFITVGLVSRALNLSVFILLLGGWALMALGILLYPRELPE